MRQNFNDVLQRSTSVQVEAHWEPIADSTFSLHKESPEHIELFNLSPSYPIKEYGIDAFKTFLPPSSLAVGDVWELDLDGVVPFLLQFHPGATTALKQGEEGAYRVFTCPFVRVCGNYFTNSCGFHRGSPCRLGLGVERRIGCGGLDGGSPFYSVAVCGAIGYQP